MGTGNLVRMSIALAFAATPVSAQTLTTLYSFTGGADGSAPRTGLLYRNGLLYGTTAQGGLPGCGGNGCGTLFSFDPTTGVKAILFNFTGGADGSTPLAGLIAKGTFL
jgi:uncharacterized repeat protein (TIGR03803 family)